MNRLNGVSIYIPYFERLELSGKSGKSSLLERRYDASSKLFKQMTIHTINYYLFYHFVSMQVITS